MFWANIRVSQLIKTLSEHEIISNVYNKWMFIKPIHNKNILEEPALKIILSR